MSYSLKLFTSLTNGPFGFYSKPNKPEEAESRPLAFFELQADYLANKKWYCRELATRAINIPLILTESIIAITMIAYLVFEMIAKAVLWIIGQFTNRFKKYQDQMQIGTTAKIACLSVVQLLSSTTVGFLYPTWNVAIHDNTDEYIFP